MPITVEIPDGVAEFPDDFTEEQISEALSRSYGPKPTADTVAHIPDSFRGAGLGADQPGQAIEFGTGPQREAYPVPSPEDLAQSAERDSLASAISVTPQQVADAADVIQGAFAAVPNPDDPFSREMMRPDVFAQVAGQRQRIPTTTEQVIAGAQNVGAGLAASFTEPVVAGGIAAGAVFPPIAPWVAGGFAADMLAHLPEQAREAGRASVEGTPFEKTVAYGNLAASAGFIPGLGREAYRGLKPQVSEGLRALSELTPSGQIARADRIQAAQWLDQHNRRNAAISQLEAQPPSPDRDAQLQQLRDRQADIGLSEPHQKLVDQMIADSPLPAEVVWGARRKPGQYAGLKYDAEGKAVGIDVYGETVPNWIEQVAKKRRGAAFERTADEEFIHSQTPREDAELVAESASPLEKWIAQKNYGSKVEGADLGWEIIRQRIQKMSGGSREAIESTFEDRLDVRALEILDTLAQKLRIFGRNKGAKASAVTERIRQNVEAAKAARAKAPLAPEDLAATEAEIGGETPEPTPPISEPVPPKGDAADLALEEGAPEPEPDIPTGPLTQAENREMAGMQVEIERMKASPPTKKPKQSKADFAKAQTAHQAELAMLQRDYQALADRVVQHGVGPAATIKTEADVDRMGVGDLRKLGHRDGIAYGITLGPEDVPRLESKYAQAHKDMIEAVRANDDARQLAAFGRNNFYGGALQGATKGNHAAAAGNYELFRQQEGLGPAAIVKTQADFNRDSEKFRAVNALPVTFNDTLAKHLAGGPSNPDVAKFLKEHPEYGKFHYDNPAAISKGRRELVRENPEFGYYATRLLNRELLDKAVPIDTGSGFGGYLAVPVGGNRRSGYLGCADTFSKQVAHKVADELRSEKGFPNLRVENVPTREGGPTGPQDYMVAWGDPIDFDTGFGTRAYHDRLGKQFGYKDYGPEEPVMPLEPPSQKQFNFGPAARIRRTFKQEQADKLADLRRAAAEGREAPTLKGPSGQLTGQEPVAPQERVGPTAMGQPASRAEKVVAPQIEGPLTSNVADQFSGAYFSQRETPSFDDFKGQFQARFGATPEGSLREVFKSNLMQSLANAPGAKLESLIKNLNLTSRFQGRGAKPGQRVVGKIADPIGAPVGPQVEFAFEPGEGVQSKGRKLAQAVKRAQEAIQLEYEYRLAAGRATQLRNELRAIGIADVTANGRVVDFNRKARQPDSIEESGKAKELMMLRRWMDEAMDPDKDVRENLLALASRKLKPTSANEQRMREEEGMMARPAFQPAPPPKTRTFTKAQQRRFNIIATIHDVLSEKADMGKKSATRKSVTPDDLGSQAVAKEPVFWQITTDQLKRPEDVGQRLVKDARVSGEKVSLTHRLVAMMNKTTGTVDLVDTYLDPRRGPVVMSPGLTEVHVPFETMLKTHRPLYSAFIDDPVVNFKQRFSNLKDFEENFARPSFRRQAGGEWATAGETTPTAIKSGIRLASTAGELESSLTGPISDREVGAVIDHILGEVGKFDSPEDLQTSISRLREVADREPLNRQNLAAIAGLEKMFEATRRKHPDMSSDQALEKMASDLELISRQNSYEYTDQRTGQTRTGYHTDTVIKQILGLYGRRPEISAPEVQEAAPSPTARELTTPSIRRPIPGAGGPPLRGITGQAATLAAQAAERASTGRAEAVTRDIQAAPPEPTPGEKAFLGTGRAAREAQAEVETEADPTHYTQGPAATIRNAQAKIQDEFTKLKGVMKANFARREAEQDIVRWRDSADTIANNMARQSGNSIRVQSDNPEVRAAAKAVIASGGNLGKLQDFMVQIDNGIQNAQALIQTRNPINMRAGSSWLKAAKKLQKEVEYAEAHWNDPELQNTAQAVRREMQDEFVVETNNGINLRRAENYIPGRYDAEFFNDDAVMFGEQRVLGRNFRKPKSFPDYYAAIESGPYIPKSYDVADLVEHRVRQGRKEINKKMWLESLKGLTDPQSGQPVVVDAVKVGKQWTSPTPEHELFSLGPGKEPVAVRVGYKNLLDVLTLQSHIGKSPIGRAALISTGFLKHGIILIFDTFHPARLGQYALALHGTGAGYKGAFSALEYRDADLPRAVALGHITPEAAKWASDPVKVTLPNGKTGSMTRRRVLEGIISNGLNVGRIQDAIYKDVVKNWPVIGKMNRWVFDKFTRGLMAEGAVRELERRSGDEPGKSYQRLASEIAKDLNFYYGSIGRQGWIRNPTIRDMTQIMFLAPQWVEGLVQKEARFIGRLATSPVKLAQGKDPLGTLGRGMGNGMVGYFLLTQIINLITRGQTTFQNPEDEHKMDAFIPTDSEGNGFWLSPLSVFGEVTHDVLRYGESKPNTVEAIRKIGENKLGPWGRMGLVLATRENPEGERLTGGWKIAGSMAGQLIPAPISLGTPARSLASWMAPDVVSPPPPGALPRQLLASGGGIKVQSARTSLGTIQDLARNFVEKNNLKPETGWMETKTDEASYTDLRRALISDSQKDFNRTYDRLLKGRDEDKIEQAMDHWLNRSFSGSQENEDLFQASLTDEQNRTYEAALLEKQRLYDKFQEFVARRR